MVESGNSISDAWKDAMRYRFTSFLRADVPSNVPRSVKSRVSIALRLASSLLSQLDEGHVPKQTAVTTRSYGGF
jgi:hypothetical protein